jgi:SAM-dependent methyltransferase
MTTTVETPTDAPPEAGQITERIFGEGLGAFHLLTVYLGIRLGLFEALAENPGSTVAQLAATTSADARYVREWVQAETIAGLLEADGEDYSTATFRLSIGVREALVDQVHPGYVGGVPMALAALGTGLSSVLDAYRTGAGVPMSSYGPEVVHAQAAFNRPMYVNELTQTVLPQVTELHSRLADATRPARVADVGCGAGWASIELAKAYPSITVDGYDNDEPSIEQARRNAAEHGVADRVRFRSTDASAAPYGRDEYDAVFFFECVHDFGRPVEALASARAAIADGGAVIVMDEGVGERPRIGDPIETFFATASATWCLPQSRMVPDCEAPGAVMRPATLEAFARRAGWAGVEVLPIEHPVFRFYRLAE